MWRKPPELPLDRQVVNGMISKLMEIDAKLDWIVARLREDEDDAEEDES